MGKKLSNKLKGIDKKISDVTILNLDNSKNIIVTFKLSDSVMLPKEHVGYICKSIKEIFINAGYDDNSVSILPLGLNGMNIENINILQVNKTDSLIE